MLIAVHSRRTSGIKKLWISHDWRKICKIILLLLKLEQLTFPQFRAWSTSDKRQSLVAAIVLVERVVNDLSLSLSLCIYGLFMIDLIYENSKTIFDARTSVMVMRAPNDRRGYGIAE